MTPALRRSTISTLENIVLIGLFYLIYVLIYIHLFFVFGPALKTIGVLPAVLMSWFRGLRSGIVASLILFPLSIFVLPFSHEHTILGTDTYVITSAMLECGTALLISLCIGFLNEVRQKLADELLSKTRAQKALLHSYETLEKSRNIIRRSQKKLKEQTEDLRRMNNELNNFVHTVSHDLKTPITTLISFSTLLERKYQDVLDETGQKYLSRIRKNCDKLRSQIDDLLTLSRLSKLNNPFEEFNAMAIFQSIFERLDLEISHKNVNIEIPKSLPDIVGDRIKLTELFYNLVTNAIKFSSKNQNQSPRIKIGYAHRNNEHQFSISDNGIGIDPMHHRDIFELFNRLHSKAEYDGTGMGLSIVKRIAADHGGSVSIDSRIGEGATFTVSIPDNLKK